MKVPIFKAHGDDIDQDFKGFYYAKPETTYCIDEDYKKHPVKMLHYLIITSMTDWGLPNQTKMVTIDPSTLEQIGFADTEDELFLPRNEVVENGSN